MGLYPETRLTRALVFGAVEVQVGQNNCQLHVEVCEVYLIPCSCVGGRGSILLVILRPKHKEHVSRTAAQQE